MSRQTEMGFAEFAAGVVGGVVTEANREEQVLARLRRHPVQPAVSSLLAGDEPGVRMVLYTGDVVAHAVPVSLDRWRVRVWCVDAGTDVQLAGLALQAAEATCPPDAEMVVSVAEQESLTARALGLSEENVADIAAGRAVLRDFDLPDRFAPARDADEWAILGHRHYGALRQAVDDAHARVAFAPVLARAPGLLLLDQAYELNGGYQAIGSWHGDYGWRFDNRFGTAELRIFPAGGPLDRALLAGVVRHGDAQSRPITHFQAARLFAECVADLQPDDRVFVLDAHLADGSTVQVTALAFDKEEAIEELVRGYPYLANATSFAVVSDTERELPASMPDFVLEKEARA